MRRVLGRIALVSALLAPTGCRYDWDSLSSDHGDANAGCRSQRARLTCPTGASLCETFDTGDFDSGVWSRGQVNATLLVETMSIQNAGEGLRADLRETQTETPTPMSHYFVRLFVFMPSPLPATEVKLAQIIEATSSKGVTLRTDTSGFLAINNNLATGGGLKTSATRMPTDAWTCLELEIQVGTLGRIAVRLDDQVPPILDFVDDVASTPPLGQIHVGLPGNMINDVPLDAFAFWFDEVIIDDAPIGCSD
jgi:hypothetical protein